MINPALYQLIVLRAELLAAELGHSRLGQILLLSLGLLFHQMCIRGLQVIDHLDTHCINDTSMT